MTSEVTYKSRIWYGGKMILAICFSRKRYYTLRIGQIVWCRSIDTQPIDFCLDYYQLSLAIPLWLGCLLLICGSTCRRKDNLPYQQSSHPGPEGTLENREVRKLKKIEKDQWFSFFKIRKKIRRRLKVRSAIIICSSMFLFPYE